jgi:Predicted metal-binding integral membrane protein (DUF2182)
MSPQAAKELRGLSTTEVRDSASAHQTVTTMPTIVVLLTAVAVAWVVTVMRLAGMDGAPGADPGPLGFYASTWTVMMVAMMLPSALPSVAARPNTSERALFALGYLGVWALAGLPAYAALKLGHQLDGGLFGWHHAGRPTAATLLLLAAAYELTPAKRRSLARCNTNRPTPDGPQSALRGGIANAVNCVICCCGLMVALFALGEMNLTWMLIFTAVIAGEKLAPWRTTTTTIAATLLLTLGIGLAASPRTVPSLTIPTKSTAMPTMARGTDATARR